MKDILLRLLLPLLTFPLFSFKSDSLLNQPMPVLPNKTLDGKTIDKNFYKDHITLVTFMYIGCLPCMNEISMLNKIYDDYAANNTVQVLCVARQMKEQMVQFNTIDTSLFGKIRKALGADPIKYAIQPICNNTKSKMEKSGSGESQNINIKSECSTIEETFKVYSYPTAFYIDKKGIIRKIEVGGPGEKNDTHFYDRVKKEIDLLLAE